MLPRALMVTKKIPAAFALLFVALMAAFLTGCRPPGPKALLDGKRLLDKGNIPEAIERLQVATEILRTNAVAWNYLGIALHQGRQSSNAVIAYRRAMATDPDMMEARLNLGTLLLELGRAGEAKSEFTGYTLRRPNAVEGFQKLAAAEMQLREFVQAEQHLGRALQLDDANPDSWNSLGLVQVQRNRVRDAAQSFSTALQRRSGFAPALLNLAIVSQQHLGDKPAALKLYRQYLGTNPAPPDADAISGIIRQLEIELAPPRPRVVVQTPPPAPVPAPDAASGDAARNTKRPAVVAQTAITNPPAVRTSPPPVAVLKPEPPQPKPVTPPPQIVRPLPTLVKLQPEPEIRVAPVSEVRVAKVAATSPVPVEVVIEQPVAPVIVASKEKKGFLQSLNPFKRDTNKTAAPEAAPTDAGRVTSHGVPDPATSRPPVTVVEVVTIPAASLTQPSTAPRADGRYAYRGAGSTTPGDRTAAQRFAAKGAQALESKRYIEAATAFRSAAGADPGWFPAQLNHAAAALQAGRVVESLHAGETALALQPDSTEARYNFALALKQGNFSQDAANELERLLVANPSDARAHLALGNLYAEPLRQADKARVHYLRVLEMEPRHPRAASINFWLKANPRK